MNVDKRFTLSVAESQALALSESSDTGLAPGQTGKAPQSPNQALGKLAGLLPFRNMSFDPQAKGSGSF